MRIIEGSLEMPQPFSLRLTLYMGQAFRWRRLDGSVDRLQHRELLPDNAWHSGVLGQSLFHLRQSGSAVEYRVVTLDETVGNEDVAAMLHSYFRLDDDVSRIYGHLSDHDANMAKLIATYGGMRLLRQDPWECLVSYVCSKSNRIPNIRRCIGEMSPLSGVSVEMGNDRRYLFPSAQSIVEIGIARLLGLDLAGRFAASFPVAIAGAAKRVQKGEIDAQELRRSAYSTVMFKLMQGPRNGRTVPNGIGLKIADCVALMSLDKLEAFPVDTHIKRAVAANYPAAPKSEAAIGTWAQQHFGQFAGYAGQLMFCDQPK